MVAKCYVAHEVVMRKSYVKFKYESDSRSCHFSNYYYISRKCVLLIKDNDGSYIYVSNRNKCKVIDPNNLEIISTTLACHQCDMTRNKGIDCDLKVNTPDKLLGVVDIQPIQSFTRTTNLSLAITLIKEYNNSINEEDEYVYVDDLKYIDIIREIDDSVGRSKVRSI